MGARRPTEQVTGRRRGRGLRLGSFVVCLVLSGVLAGVLAGCGDEPPEQEQAHPTASPKTGDPLSSQAAEAEKEARKHQSTATPSGPSAPASSGSKGPVLGADVSWPQCPKGMGIPQRLSEGLPMPAPSVGYVVIGLTNGPGFTQNPCLADQFAWARQHEVPLAAYAVVSWPAADRPGGVDHDGPYPDTQRGRSANAGYQQALFNVRTMGRLGMRTPVVWVDVEPYPVFPWPADTARNAAVVRGAVRAYQDAGFRVGLYSTPNLWRAVVGDLRLGLPEWRAAGKTSRAEALARCGSDWSFQGGSSVLAQWTTGDADHNVTCPGSAKELGTWFQQP